MRRFGRPESAIAKPAAGRLACMRFDTIPESVLFRIHENFVEPRTVAILLSGIITGCSGGPTARCRGDIELVPEILACSWPLPAP